MMSSNENGKTNPTIETVLGRVNQICDNLRGLQADLGVLKSDLSSVKIETSALRNEFQLFRGEMEIRIDRVEGMTNQTRAEMLNLRADFREWKDLLNASEA